MIAKKLQITPALRLLIWFFLGVHSVLIFKFSLYSPPAILFLLLICLWAWFARIANAEFSICFLAIFLTLFITSLPSNHFSKFLTKPNENRTVQLHFLENFYSKKSSFSSYASKVAITKIKDNSTWQKTCGKALLIFDKKQNNPHYYKNSFLETNVAFYKLDSQNPYEKSLIFKGFTHKLTPTNIISQKQQPPNFITKLQQKIIQKISYKLDKKNKNLLLAMFLGKKQALSYTDKQTYSQSGIMHIFAISGLHIGIMFTILLLITRLLLIPRSLRYLILPFLLYLYVLLVGSPDSALRAWLMLSIWSFSQLAKKAVPAINTIALSALIILVFSPTSYLQASFQYSFLIVTLLILANGFFTPFLTALKEKTLWQNKAYYNTDFFAKALHYLFIIFVAWLASIPLNLLFSSQIIPSSFFINLALGSIVWLILFATCIKVVFPFLFADSLNFLLDLAHQLGSTGSLPINFTWGALSPTLFFLYFTLLILAFYLPLRFRWRISFFAGAIALIIIPKLFHKPRLIYAFEAGSLTPQIAYIDKFRKVYLINCPSYKITKNLQKKLRHLSFPSISTLILPHHQSRFSGAINLIDKSTLIMTPKFNKKNTRLFKLYKKNKSSYNFLLSSKNNQGIQINKSGKSTKIIFPFHTTKLIINYIQTPYQFTKITYQFWQQNKLIKSHSLIHKPSWKDTLLTLYL